jgi:hypothetical protein
MVRSPHFKKRSAIFPSPARASEGKIANLFYNVFFNCKREALFHSWPFSLRYKLRVDTTLLPEGEETCAVVCLGKYLVRTAWTQV